MGLFRTLFVAMLFAARILLTSSYGIPYPDRTPDICGGYCKGTTGIGILLGPCHEYSLTLDEEKKKENAACEWANDHCCPPNGNGSEWTTTTTTTTLRTTTNAAPTHRVPFPTDDDSDDKKIEEIKETMLLWMLSVAFGTFAIYAGIGVCIYCCLKGQQQNQPSAAMYQGASVYPGGGTQSVIYQLKPVMQPQPQAPITPLDPSKV